MSKLTKRQRQLLQEDKYNLVDLIIELEDVVIKAQQELDNKRKPVNMSNKQQVNLVDALNKSIGLDGQTAKLENKLNEIEFHLDTVWAGEMTETQFVREVTKMFANQPDEELPFETSKEDCYPCATQRHACEHDEYDDENEEPEHLKHI